MGRELGGGRHSADKVSLNYKRENAGLSHTAAETALAILALPETLRLSFDENVDIIHIVSCKQRKPIPALQTISGGTQIHRI